MSAASEAAQRLGGKVLGPLMPALSGAKDALGTAAKYAGAAGALLSGGSPAGTAFADLAGKLGEASKSVDLSEHTQMAAGAASAALAPKISAAVMDAAAKLGGAAGGARPAVVVVAVLVREPVRRPRAAVAPATSR